MKKYRYWTGIQENLGIPSNMMRQKDWSWSNDGGVWKDDSLAMKKRETKHMRREGKTREQHTWSRECGMWKDEEKNPPT